MSSCFRINGIDDHIPISDLYIVVVIVVMVEGEWMKIVQWGSAILRSVNNNTLVLSMSVLDIAL